MAKPSGPSPALEPLLASKCHLAFEQDGEPVAVRESGGFGLSFQILEALGHAVQAELDEAIEGGVGQHGRSQWK